MLDVAGTRFAVYAATENKNRGEHQPHNEKENGMKNAEWIQRRRAQHHAALETLAATVGCKTNGLTLWRQLRRIECRVYSACEAYSSDSNFGLARWESAKEQAKADLVKVFGGAIPAGVFINGDPRGHMLKLDNDEVAIPEGMQCDWGGNGILAATID